MGKAIKEILLGHHFIPVPVHLLPKVSVLALLQLDQSCDLLPSERDTLRCGLTPVPSEHTWPCPVCFVMDLPA